MAYFLAQNHLNNREKGKKKKKERSRDESSLAQDQAEFGCSFPIASTKHSGQGDGAGGNPLLQLVPCQKNVLQCWRDQK